MRIDSQKKRELILLAQNTIGWLDRQKQDIYSRLGNSIDGSGIVPEQLPGFIAD